MDALEFKAARVLNANVLTLDRKKKWKEEGPKFRNDAKMSAIIVRALYNLKSASDLAQCMWKLGYESCNQPVNKA